MKFSDKGIMAYSGTIRGAIAFGLACSLEIENELHRTVLISGTLALVLGTTVIFGAFMPIWVSFMKSYDSDQDREDALNAAKIPAVNENLFGFDFSHPNFNEEILYSKEKDPDEFNKRLSTYVKNLWCDFDDNSLKPFLLYDYPKCLEDHKNLTEKLLAATTDLSDIAMGKNKTTIATENELQELKSGAIFGSNK
jgi:hypothetical protein